MTRDKAMILLGLLILAGVCALVMAVVNLLSALEHPDRWSGFMVMLFAVFAVGVAVAVVIKVMPRR
ncbi:MAG TPA: hypothetical protein VK453_01840 [Micromonosporaceae bacterium]|nr:hypothetical protein [Micromonosporaceae bacterium]